ASLVEILGVAAAPLRQDGPAAEPVGGESVGNSTALRQQSCSKRFALGQITVDMAANSRRKTRNSG
ncbi:hypothetical protein, partial [Nocardia pseudovaccinii]|uniref:hypothetical protein n=1 Tax=Nocardia pseudovaccinii TaxID=189540 RepID=UPI001C3F7ABB